LELSISYSARYSKSAILTSIRCRPVNRYLLNCLLDLTRATYGAQKAHVASWISRVYEVGVVRGEVRGSTSPVVADGAYGARPASTHCKALAWARWRPTSWSATAASCGSAYWIRVVRAAIHGVFASERRLCFHTLREKGFVAMGHFFKERLTLEQPLQWPWRSWAGSRMPGYTSEFGLPRQ
jgi:hypothetical protein